MLPIIITLAVLAAGLIHRVSSRPPEMRYSLVLPLFFSFVAGSVVAVLGLILAPQEDVEGPEVRVPVTALEPVQAAGGPAYRATVLNPDGSERLMQVPGDTPVTRTEEGSEGYLVHRTTETRANPTAKWWLYLPFMGPRARSQSEVLEVQVPESMGAPVDSEGRQP